MKQTILDPKYDKMLEADLLKIEDAIFLKLGLDLESTRVQNLLSEIFDIEEEIILREHYYLFDTKKVKKLI